LQARVQQWIILFNSNLDTDRPKSLSALRAMLNETEASRKRDKDRGKDDAVQQLATSDGLAKYARDKKGDFERLRQDILNRSKKGNGKDSPIEVD
jgi:E3 ubiquitin-protein ligase RAD18